MDGQKQQIREKLFDPARQDELVTALLSTCPEITATPQAVRMEADAEDDGLDIDSDAGEETDATDGGE